MKSFFYIICFFLFLSFSSNAQSVVSGQAYDSLLQKPVSRAYIHNVSFGFLAVADSAGFFSIPATVGDTLLFSSIGYFWNMHVVEHTESIDIYMAPQVYELDKVRKYAMLPYHELTQKILEIPFYRDSLRLGLHFEKYYPMREYVPGQLSYSIDGLITAVYNSVNKHARNKIRAIELIENAHTIIVINQKFSKSLVQELTNLPDEQLDDFISFLHLTDDFLYHASQYVIIAYMYAQFDEYMLKNPQLQLH
jgi:hypothetical protein